MNKANFLKAWEACDGDCFDAIYYDGERWAGYDWITIEDVEEIGLDDAIFHKRSESIGEHPCKSSALYDDDKDYVDMLTYEDLMLHDGIYDVLYWEIIDQDDLILRCDRCMDKVSILRNILNQKYREGAWYYKMEVDL